MSLFVLNSRNGGGTWGTITGTLASQTDLQLELDQKLDIVDFEPAGLDKQVQFNDGGVFGGDAGFTFDKTSQTLTSPKLVVDTVTPDTKFIFTESTTVLGTFPTVEAVSPDGDGVILQKGGLFLVGTTGLGDAPFLQFFNGANLFDYSYLSYHDQILEIYLTEFGDAQYLYINGRVQVGSSGALLRNILSNTASLNFPSIAANSVQQLTMTVTGALVGDSVVIGAPSTLNANLTFCGFVSASNTITIRVHNGSASAIDPASATWRATVINF